MTDDLVKRLRSPANVFYEYAADVGAFLREAADRIEKLEEQAHYANGVADLAMKHRDYAEQRVEKLEAALRDLSDGWECCPVSQAMRRVARHALEGKDD